MMDQEVEIISSATRKEKIKNFFINKKKQIIATVIFFLLILFGFFFYQEYEKDIGSGWLTNIMQRLLNMKQAINQKF